MKDVDKKPGKEVEKELEKGTYTKPVVIKHKRLTEMTAGFAGSPPFSE